jgi:hypothetical protein
MGTNLIRISACNEQQQHFGEGESVAARAMKEIALKGGGGGDATKKTSTKDQTNPNDK